MATASVIFHFGYSVKMGGVLVQSPKACLSLPDPRSSCSVASVFVFFSPFLSFLILIQHLTGNSMPHPPWVWPKYKGGNRMYGRYGYGGYPLDFFFRGPLLLCSRAALVAGIWSLGDPSLGLSWFSSQLEMEQVLRASRRNQEHTSWLPTSSLHNSTGKRNSRQREGNCIPCIGLCRLVE